MKLLLERIFTNDRYTIGHLYCVNDITNEKIFICDTLEDCDRGLTQDMKLSDINKRKVYTKTAIPTGTYDIALNVKSPKYSNYNKYPAYQEWDGYLPRLRKVPGFDGILLHIGNSEQDSSGCILVGENKVVGKVINSTVTFRKFMNEWIVPCRERKEKVTLEITSKYKK